MCVGKGGTLEYTPLYEKAQKETRNWRLLNMCRNGLIGMYNKGHFWETKKYEYVGGTIFSNYKS